MKHIFVFFVWLLVFAATPAHAEENNEIYQAVHGIEESSLYLFPTGDIALEEEVAQALTEKHIGVVVIPASSTMDSFNQLVKDQEGSDGRAYDNFADAVLDYTSSEQYNTVIVLSANKYEFATRGSEYNIEDILAGSNARNTQKIILGADQIEEESVPTDSLFVLLILLSFIGSAIALFCSIIFIPDIIEWLKDKKYTSRLKKQKKINEKRAAEVEKNALAKDLLYRETPKALPKSVRVQLEELRIWTNKNIVPSDKDFSLKIKLMLERFQIFYERLEERSDAQNRKVALVEYTAMLSKINGALSDKYYLDICENPTLWDEPEERKQQVQRAVEGISMQLLENIKQVNGERDLDFKASLAWLEGFMVSPKIEELYKK